MCKAYKRYKIYLASSYKSPSTQSRYSVYVRNLILWLDQRGVISFKRTKRSVLEEWVADISQTRAPATIKPIVAAARSFFRWACDIELISRKKLRKLLKALRLPRVPKNVQRTLSIDEVRQLLEACDLGTVKGLRNAAIISALLDTGLRASELCRLTINDLSFDVALAPGARVNRFVVIVKGGRRQSAYFGQRTAEHLRAWLDVRQEIAAVDRLFVSLVRSNPGSALDRHGLKQILRNVGGEAGVSNVSPHAFRRTFAVILDLAGASTKVAKDLGRWESVEMVLLYQRGYQAALQYNDVAPLDFILRHS